jgi:hypothetical protein
MAQVRLIQIGAATPGTAIQIGRIGATLNGQVSQPLQTIPAAANIQLGKFNNTYGTFYKDPTNLSAGGAGQQIQVGTNIADRTLGYITGTGIPTVTVIPTNATGAGYFSIWNAGAVQGGFQIQIPTCTGQQIKTTGSQSNQPAVNQAVQTAATNQGVQTAATNQGVQQAAKNQSVQQAAKNQSIQTAAKNQTLQQTLKNQSVQQPLNQQPANNQPGIHYPGLHWPAYDYPGFYNDNVYYPGAHGGGVDQPGFYVPPNQQPAFQQPLVNQSVQQPLVNQSVQQAAVNQSINQPLVNQSINQPLVNQSQQIAAVNQSQQIAAVNQSINQALVITPSTNQPASGALYNGSWVNTAPGTGQNAGGFVLTIPNIGTLTTQGGAFSGTGAGGSFQAFGTYTRTASAAVSTQQGVVNFQVTTRN